METKLGSRAVIRHIEAGNVPDCQACGERVKFNAKVPSPERKQVIANVYKGGKWSHVETYHLVCYQEAGSPHGEVG